MSTNFLQWNANQTNQQNDTAYANDTQRAGGAGNNAVFPAQLANKLFFQQSTMVAALGQVISDYGHNASDNNAADLVIALKDTFAARNGNATNTFEAANGTSGNNVVNYSQFGGSLATTGYQRLPGGLIIQWGYVSESTNNTDYRSFPITFPTACRSLLVQLDVATTLGWGGDYGTIVQIVDTTKFLWNASGSFAGGGWAYFIAIGH